MTVLNGYKIFVKTNGNKEEVKKDIGLTLEDCDLDDLYSLKAFLFDYNLYSESAYDNYIEFVCEEFSVYRCNTCHEFVREELLDCCESCNEYICEKCLDYGCDCGYNSDFL